MTQPSADYDSILQHQNKAWTRAGVIALAIACVIIVSSYHSGLLDLERLGSGFPALWQLGTEMFPRISTEAWSGSALSSTLWR